MGFFYDDDGDASTDNVLIAHQLTDGSWVQNRDVLSDGSVITLAYGNDGIAFADYNALLAALTVNGLTVCDYASTPTACLAGADTIDDLAKFNLTFIIDPSGVTADSFTVRIDSAAAPVPEPGSFALAALALGAAGVSLRRRR
jgi:hypothetical protein